MKSLGHKFNLSTVILVINLVVYSRIIVGSSHYERLTGDSTLYLSIAEKYISGDLGNAVNGYWGPLLAWLLAPFLYLGSTHVFAVNALNLIIGILTIIGIWRLSCKFNFSENIRAIVLLPLVPILSFVSLIQPMDFLLLCILVYYLNVVFDKNYPSSPYNAVSAGALGALAYFAKPYGFPFFISHFLLINAGHYFGSRARQDKRNVLRNLVVGFLLFGLLSGPWIALISQKYDRITFSTMGRGVLAALGPGSEHETLEKGDPIFFEGFIEPPNETAFVIYEDPTYARNESWNPLESRRSFKHLLSNIAKNLFEGLRVYESFSRLAGPILIVYLLMILALPFNKLFSRRELLFPFLTILLYTGGYTLFHFEARYLWIVNILLLLMGGQVLNELFRGEFFRTKAVRNVLSLLFVLSFIITPLKSQADMSQNNINGRMHALGVKLAGRYDIHGNIASNRMVSSHDSWHRTFRLAYWLKSSYYGQAREGISDDELERDLKKYGINYYFFWGDPADVPGFLSQYTEITECEIPGLMIYSLNGEEDH